MRWLLLLLLFLPHAEATTFVDSRTGDEIALAVVVTRTGGEFSHFLLSPQQPFDLRGDPEEILIEGEQTYAYLATRPPNGWPSTIVMSPVGLLMGSVQDAQQNYMQNASIIIHCPTVQLRIQADVAGMFRALLPVGNCSVSAVVGDRSATTDVTIAQGFTARARLVFAEEEASFSMVILAGLLALLIALVSVFALRTKECPAQEHRDVLTLRERLIVDELAGRGGKASMAELRTATSLPRTSLVRTVQGLENRGLVLRRGEGRRTVVELRLKSAQSGKSSNEKLYGEE